MDNEKIYSSKKELLRLLEIKENFLYSNFSTQYRTQEKTKKNGGLRTIKPPSYVLKKIQRKILDKILYNTPQLECVYGLSGKKGILNNAKTHEINMFGQLVVLDIENFFPSISAKEVKKVFKKIGFEKENASVLTKLCTVDNSLPQGSPTSPYLASMVCSRLDKEIYLYCKRRDLIYTRYFDDISISGKKVLHKHIKHVEKLILKSRFESNENKKDFFDTNKNKIINGILITSTGLSVPEEYKQEIEHTYKLLTTENSLKNQRTFAGKFGFYLHINREEALSFLETLKKSADKI